MKKRGRKSKKQIDSRVSKIKSTNDDDIFEDVHCPPKLRPKLKTVKKESPPPSSSSSSKKTIATCQLTRSRAACTKSLALLTNGKSDNTKKHVDKNCNMSSQILLGKKAKRITLSDSEEDDFELDLEPQGKKRSNLDEGDTIAVKRRKTNVFYNFNDDNNDGASGTNEHTHGDPSGSQNDETGSTKSNDEIVSIGANISEIDDELEIDAEIELELEPTVNEKQAATKPSASRDEPENGENEQDYADEPEDIDSEPPEITKEPTENTDEPEPNTDDENEKDQENGDDEDFLQVDIDEELNGIFGVLDDETVSRSPALRAKQTNKMFTPKWKKTVAVETPLPKQQIVHKITRTITMTGDATVTVSVPSVRAPVSTLAPSSASSNELGRPSKVPFKIPQLKKPTNSATNTVTSNAVNRDPRISKDVTPNIAATAAPPSIVTAPKVQNNNETASVAPLANNVGGQRVPAKQRLGNRFAVKSSRSSFIIPNDTSASNSVPVSTSIAAVSVQKQQPKKAGLYTSTFRSMQAAQSHQSRRNIQQPHPDMPEFVREALESKLNATELKIPEFAMGTQKFEPLFFRVFERTCRTFIQDDCNSTECQYEHKLPDSDFFRKTLDRIDAKRVVELYDDFICRNQKLFDFYFLEFTTFFGKNSMTFKLKQMVEDCIERKVQFHFMKIVEGFMLAGKPFSKALAEVIQAISQRTMKTQNELIKLVLHVRNDSIQPFVQFLDVLSKQENFKFATEWVNRMMFIQREVKLNELSKVIWRIINDNISILQKCDRELVEQFMDDVKTQEFTFDL